MTRALFAALALLLAAALNTQPASAQTQERIVDFHSEIWVNADASMTVRETITVDSAGRKIRRGIFRDFPTIYKSPSGRRSVVGFQLEQVLRNSRSEPFHTERRSNGVRIYIGDANILIPAGRHVYEISYRTNRQLGFFDAIDELFWNVTGNGWDFPIERARATVHLPSGATAVDHAGYTGRTGARGADFTYAGKSDKTVTFETNRTLKSGEGLSIAVSWPRGFVQRPTNGQMLAYSLSDNRFVIIAVLGPIILLVYFLTIWFRVGRDPEKGPIVPRYEPPKGFSPAGARYVLNMGFDDKSFTAAIVNMAVKGFLTIKEGGWQVYTLELTGQSPGLSKGESAVARKLFPGATVSIELEQDNHETLQSAKLALQGSFRKEFEKIYFIRNERYFLPGIAFTVLALILLIGSDVSVLTLNDARLAISAIASFGSMIILNFVFYRLLKAPTRLGRKTMDEIEGFKDYLSVAEKDRMNLLNPPERTPELFEQFLPYALALGVEQQWSEQFSDVLAQAASEATMGGRGYSPRWYSGRSFDNGFADCASTLSGGFTGAISAASIAPGSSSGSGGGGFSGGGGGGGGGGGW
ncbi:MAG: DUF2207 domain-containing protein [Alphaproteobacteria bacterium]|nr:DUF2207 domain-containing protein [Alphaproteobacteria bacterium]